MQSPSITPSFIRPTDQLRWKAVRGLALIALVAYVCILIHFSLKSAGYMSENTQDKLLHYVIYGGLAGLIGLVFPRAPLWKIFVYTSALGGTLEIQQGMMGQGRMASWADQAANMAGILTAVLVWVLYVYIARYFGKTR